MSCSSSTVSEDGEVNNASLSLITELVLGRRTLMGGCSQEEADIKLEGKEGTEGKERGWKGRGERVKVGGRRKPIPTFKFRSRSGSKMGWDIDSVTPNVVANQTLFCGRKSLPVPSTLPRSNKISRQNQCGITSSYWERETYEIDHGASQPPPLGCGHGRMGQ